MAAGKTEAGLPNPNACAQRKDIKGTSCTHNIFTPLQTWISSFPGKTSKEVSEREVCHYPLGIAFFLGQLCPHPLGIPLLQALSCPRSPRHSHF